MVGPSTSVPSPSSWQKWWVCWLCTCSSTAIGSCAWEHELPTTSKVRPSRASPATATVTDAARALRLAPQIPHTPARHHQWAWKPSGRCPPLSCPCTPCPRVKRAPQQPLITPQRGTTTSCRSTTASRRTWKTQVATATPPTGAPHLYETDSGTSDTKSIRENVGGGGKRQIIV